MKELLKGVKLNMNGSDKKCCNRYVSEVPTFTTLSLANLSQYKAFHSKEVELESCH